MDELHDPVTVPGWVWVIVALFAIGVIVVLAIKSDRRSERRSRSHRHGGSSYGGSSGHRHRSSRRRREGGTFDKY